MNANKPAIIALDCMGGDFAPQAIIQGASIISKELNNKVKFIFCGDVETIENLLNTYRVFSEYEIYHSEVAIPSDAKPSSALRGITREYKKSSMVVAMQALRDKKVDAVISAGNTGALMVVSRYIVGMLPSIDRPAIVTCIPNEISGKFVMLDLGANIGATTEDLLQLSLMGAVFARILLNIDIPRLSLLNIGEEEIKGNDTIRNTYQTLKNTASNNLFRFCGYIEPQSIFKNITDVVVCDGFTGNVALKTMEGTAAIIKKYLTSVFTSSILSRFAYLLIRKSLKETMNLIDPRNKNGAMLIGLNGIVVKSHGSADALAFSHAISVTFQLIKHDINNKIIDEIDKCDLDFGCN